MRVAARAITALGIASASALFPAPAANAEPIAPSLCDPSDPGSSADSCAHQPTQAWPIAEGNFTSPGSPGWIFFTPSGFGGNGCGIAPDGTIGCDIVPSRWDDGSPVQAGQPGPPGSYSCGALRCPLPPPGANQLVVSPQQPAQYVQSDTTTFTRDVDVLQPGHRLLNGDAFCSVGYQGTVSCSTGTNGFTLSALGATLEIPVQR